MDSIIPALTECIPMKARRFPIGPKTSCGVRVRRHQGRQCTQTLRTLTVLGLEYLRVDDKSIDGVIVSWLLRNDRRGSVRESFETEVRASCMTAMISGPRYGSTSELQRSADAIRSRARRQYTSSVTLFLEREKKMCTHPKKGPAEFRETCFRRGNTCRSSVLYRAKHENATGELCANDGKFLHAFGGLV